jgi:hypothetical protein
LQSTQLLLQLAMRARVAVHAVALPLAVRARVAVSAVRFSLLCGHGLQSAQCLSACRAGKGCRSRSGTSACRASTASFLPSHAPVVSRPPPRALHLPPPHAPPRALVRAKRSRGFFGDVSSGPRVSSFRHVPVGHRHQIARPGAFGAARAYLNPGFEMRTLSR